MTVFGALLVRLMCIIGVERPEKAVTATMPSRRDSVIPAQKEKGAVL